jgi:hypothetical protein
MSRLPVTESETIHASQDMLERQLDKVTMQQVGVFIRGVLGGLVLQSRRFTELYDQVQEMQKRIDRMRGTGEEE